MRIDDSESDIDLKDSPEQPQHVSLPISLYPVYITSKPRTESVQLYPVDTSQEPQTTYSNQLLPISSYLLEEQLRNPVTLN